MKILKKVLIVVDMQKDFINGALGTKEAQAIVQNVINKIKEYRAMGYEIIFTRDTHNENYMNTQEGKKLPVPHCYEGTEGWEINGEIKLVQADTDKVFDKPTFGSIELMNYLVKMNDETGEEAGIEVTLIGLCTDICVISNAIIIKAAMPEISVNIIADCCAGVTPETHNNALEAMKMCQINII